MPYFLCGSNHDKKVESTNRAECDVLEQPIDETYIKGIQVSQNIITYIRGDNSTGTAEIEKASEHLTVPTCDTLSFTYTGASQGPTITGLNKDVMTVTGTESAVEVGDYTISIVPKAGYIWDDNTLKEPKVFNWKINYALIGETPTQKGTLTYTGTSQTPSWNNFDSNKLSMSGSTAATADGTYTVTFTPKSGYAWSGTDTAARTATWTINPVLVSTIPSQSGTLTYNASDQSPTWSNYDSSQLTLAGVTSSTDAGTYTATFTPKTGHAWSDGTKTTKSVNWSIGKAAGSLSVDKTTVVLDSEHTTVNVIPTIAGNGEVTVVSNNTEVATVSYTDGVIVISSVNDTTGDAVVTVSVAEGSNHFAPSDVTITVSAQFISSVLDENSWDDIAVVAAQGKATNYWAVGDVKYITVNGQIGDKLTLNNETYGVFILGFDHNASEEGSGISFGTFKTTGGIDVCLSDNGTSTENKTDGSKIFNFNHWGNYNYGGWKASDIRYDIVGSTNIAPQNYGSAKASGVVGYDATATCAISPIANTLMAALPADLRAVMKPITKYTDNVAGNTNVDSNNSASVDYLPFLSEFEVQGHKSWANEYEQNYQQRYQYYTNGNSKIKYTHSSTGTARYWRVRSPYYADKSYFCGVYTDGSAGFTDVSSGLGLSCAFLVGYDLNKLNKPTISGPSLFLSDGTEKSVSVFGFSPKLMRMSGTTSATAAGDYTITISLKDASYKWADGTSDPVTLQWKIDTVSSTLNDNSWDTIAMVAGLGQAANVWNVGDVKYINVNGQIGQKLTMNNETYGVFILGFDHNSEREGKGISFGTFKTTGGIDVCLSDNGTGYESLSDGTKIFNINHWGSYNYGGWKASDIRYDVLGSTNVAPQNYGSAKSSGVVGYDATATCATSPVSNTLMAALPADLRAVMKPITKYTDNVAGKTDVDSNNSASVDYLPFLSEYEVQGSRTYANSYEQNYQQQYQYYTDGNSKVKYTHSSSTGTARDWWVRSPYYAHTDGFCAVTADGSANLISSNTGRGVACAFLVGMDLDKLKKPTVNGSSVIIADGNSHTLELNDFDDRFMSISGTTSATASGAYSVTISLKSSLYKWSDGTADPVVIPWKIVEVSSTLNDNSWEDIATVATVGTASNYWNVGDVKYINVNGQIGQKLTMNNETYGVFILGFDHNSEREGTGISFGTFKTTGGKDVCLSDNGTSYEYLEDGSKIFNMNHWGNYNYGGWKASDIRYDVLGSTNVAPSSYGSAKSSGVVGYDATNTCATSPVSNTLMAALPSDLRAVMKPITKYTDNVAGNTNVDSNNSASIDYLPFLSEYEVQGARTYANSYEQNYQQQYQYYTNGNSKAKCTHSNTAYFRYWWVRSPECGTTYRFCRVNTGVGDASFSNANSGYGLSCAFLVGYDLKKINKPTISGPSTFISDGAAHSISLTGFNEHLMTISGRTTATSDGEYTVTISLNNPAYKWADGTTDPVTLKWKIVIVSTTLNDNSWEVISTVSASGKASNYWNVGDVKYINVNGQIGANLTLTNQTFGVFILGFDHNSDKEGTGISFGTFKTTDGIDVCLSDNGTSTTYKTDGTKMFNMNHWGASNYGGWKASDIRYDVLGSTNVAPSSYGSKKASGVVGYDANANCATSPVSNTLMAALPSDLRAVMKPITKYTDNVGGGSDSSGNVTTSIDYLPFLSEYEVHGSRSYANSYEQNYQQRYQYYTNGNSKVKYTHSSTGSARTWCVRSPGYLVDYYFCYVYTDGSAYSYNADNGYGVACAFLV